MRISSEYLPATNQILVRLLGDSSPILFGNYSVDGTPELPDIYSYDISSDFVIDNEVKLYLTGYYLIPDKLNITLPDVSVVESEVIQVLVPREDILKSQPEDMMSPHEPELSRPAHANFVVEETRPSEFLPYWARINFDNNSVAFPPGVYSDFLTYTGGGEGRLLSSTVSQSGVDVAPWSIPAPLHLEGTFTNNLPNSDFSQTYNNMSFLEPVPVGWDFTSTDPDSTIRLKVENLGLLPSLAVRYLPRFGYFGNDSIVTILTPSIAANDSIQFIVMGTVGTIKVESVTGVNSTSFISLSSDMAIIRLNVGSDAGRAKITWKLGKGIENEQYIKIIAPIASSYTGPHTWIPYTKTNTLDHVVCDNITNTNGNWKLDVGLVRVESIEEDLDQPFGWSIQSTLGTTILKLDAGNLSSDYSTYSIFLPNYLPTSLTDAGNYKIKWTGFNTDFKVISILGETTIPFQLDLPIAANIFSSPIKFEFNSFGSTQGSSKLTYFGFSPFKD